MYDYINAAFEFLAAIFILDHCYTVYKDKKVAGVSIRATAFFFVWGLWNIIYYPALEQISSFFAGLLVVASNGLWVWLLLKYRTKTTGYKPDQKPLTLEQLTRANAVRAIEFGDEWEPNESFTELTGELGEAANVLKKINRLSSDKSWLNGHDEYVYREKLKEELGDVQICLVNFCRVMDIDLEQATIEKFNATTEKNGMQTYL